MIRRLLAMPPRRRREGSQSRLQAYPMCGRARKTAHGAVPHRDIRKRKSPALGSRFPPAGGTTNRCCPSRRHARTTHSFAVCHRLRVLRTPANRRRPVVIAHRIFFPIRPFRDSAGVCQFSLALSGLAWQNGGLLLEVQGESVPLPGGCRESVAEDQ